MWFGISVAMAACSLALWCWWIGAPWLRGSQSADVARGWLLKLLWPWVEALAPVCGKFMSWHLRRSLERLLVRAGEQAYGTPQHLCAFQCVAAGLAGGAAFFAVTKVFDGLAAISISALAAGCAGALPMLRLREAIKLRKLAISRAFPFMLDMVTLCVEAGLNLHGALQQAAANGPPGPLSDELQHMLADIRAGAPRKEAMSSWAERCDLPAMHHFVAAVAQADQFGMSLGPVLRAQADQRRNERFLRAEKLAQEAPVKMMFPLIFCIFPCTFLIIAFPIAAKFLDLLE